MENSYLKTHYNEEIRPYTEFPKKLATHIADNYFGSRKGKLLDVCCGRGEFMEIYSELGFDVYGVDLEDVARDSKFPFKTVNVDKENLPFEDNFFDYVVMKSAIEHCANVYHVFENLTRVLKPGGQIMILTNDWKAIYKVFWDDEDHKTPFTAYSLEGLLLRNNFEDIITEDIFYLPFTWKSPLLKLVPRIIRNLVRIDFSPRVVISNPFIKIIKFSRETQLLGYGKKKG